MTTWHLFQGLWQVLELPLEQHVNGMVSSLTGWVVGPFRAWVLVYLLGTLLMAWFTPSDQQAYAFFRHLFRAAAIYMVISTAAQFQQFFGNLALTSIPQEVGNAIAGAAGGNGLNAAAFDNLANYAFAAGLKVFQNIPWFSFKAAILGILVLGYWFVALIAVLETFIVYLVSHMVVALGVAIGPLFVALRMFPETYRYFYGWISVLVSGVVVQILSVALLGLLLTTVGQQLNQIAGTGLGSGNLGTQVLTILDAGLLFYAGWKVAQQLFSIGQAIAGGVYMQAGQVGQFVQNAVAGMVAGAGGTEKAAASGLAAEANPSVPFGYSFSRTIGRAS